jgi:hypothetical protein
MIEVLSAVAVAGGLLVGRWVAARIHRKALAAEANDANEPPRASPPPGPSAASADASASAPFLAIDWRIFPCALGDVVLRTLDDSEAWLAGAIVLREDAPAAVLFIAPDAAGERAIYARPRPNVGLAWLAPVAEGAALVGAEPPSTLEIDGIRFERRRRLPLRAERWGTGTPEVQGTTFLGEYDAPAGEVAIVLIADGVARAWRGRRLEPGQYEVWNGEKTIL